MPRINFKRDKFGQFARVNSLVNFKGRPKGKRKSPKRKPLQSLTDGGDRGVDRMSISALKKDRQSLHAKVKDGSASDADRQRLKDVQTELKTRGLNRQKDVVAPRPKPKNGITRDGAKKLKKGDVFSAEGGSVEWRVVSNNEGVILAERKDSLKGTTKVFYAREFGEKSFELKDSAPEPKAPERLDEYRLFSPGRLKKERARLRAKIADGTATSEDHDRLQQVRDKLSPGSRAADGKPSVATEPEVPEAPETPEVKPRTAAEVHGEIRQANEDLVKELGKINFDREGGPNEEDRRQYREKVSPLAAAIRELEEEAKQIPPDRSRKVTDATTPEELQEIMQDRHPATVIDDHAVAIDDAIDKAYARGPRVVSDKETAFKALASHMRGLDAMMTKYPGVKVAAIQVADIADVTNESGSGRVGAQCFRAGHHIRIELNSKTLADVSRTVRDAKQDDERRHFHPKGWSRAPYRFNAIHEFGHALDQFANMDPQNSHKTALDRDLAMTRTHFELADVLSAAYYDATGKDSRRDERSFGHWILENMSGYSIRTTRNDDENDPLPDVNTPEAIAEGFADVEFNGENASPTSKAIHAWMIRKLKLAGHHPQEEKPLSDLSAPELVKLKRETDSQDLKDRISAEQTRRYLEGQDEKLKNETEDQRRARERSAEHRSRSFKNARRGVR